MTPQPPRWKTALMIWIGIYPTITTVMWLLWPIIAPLPIPLKTLCVTAIVVPVMAFLILPFLQKRLKNWLVN